MALMNPTFLKDKKLKAIEDLIKERFEKLKELTAQLIPLYTQIDQINDEELLDLLAWQFHIEGYELAKSIEEKRNLIKKAIELHRYKGTKHAIKEVLKALNLEGQVKEWFEYNGQPYHFKVELGITNREITPQLRDKLIKLIEDYKNVRSKLEEITLYYLSKGNAYISAGNIGETEAIAHQIDGFEWASQGYPYIYAGSMGEVEAWAQ